MAHQVHNEEDTLSEVNVIPLADLSLVLLIILMVISPLVSQALIKVASGQASAAHSIEEVTEPQTPIIVTFEPGALKINGTAMGSDIEFVRRLQEMLGKRREKSVILSASPKLAHGKVVYLMDVVKRQGVSDLVMVKWKGDEDGQEVASAKGVSSLLSALGSSRGAVR